MSTLPLAVVLAAALAEAPSAAPAVRIERFTGTARDPAGALLYREEHEVRRDGARLLSARTVYTSPQGAVLATLETDFSADPFAPAYVFRDLRTGEVEAVARAGERLELRHGERVKVVGPPADPRRRLAAGQGLDRLVRARLEEVLAGAPLELAYALPNRQGTYDLRVRALGDGKGPVVRVRAEFSSWLLRLLAPSLEVEYDRDTRRLLRYRGVSNLTFDGDAPEVEIVYHHPPAAEGPAREEEPRAAL